jgi:hypothetical protein
MAAEALPRGPAPTPEQMRKELSERLMKLKDDVHKKQEFTPIEIADFKREVLRVKTQIGTSITPVEKTALDDIEKVIEVQGNFPDINSTGEKIGEWMKKLGDMKDKIADIGAAVLKRLAKFFKDGWIHDLLVELKSSERAQMKDLLKAFPNVPNFSEDEKKAMSGLRKAIDADAIRTRSAFINRIPPNNRTSLTPEFVQANSYDFSDHLQRLADAAGGTTNVEKLKEISKGIADSEEATTKKQPMVPLDTVTSPAPQPPPGAPQKKATETAQATPPVAPPAAPAPAPKIPAKSAPAKTPNPKSA